MNKKQKSFASIFLLFLVGISVEAAEWSTEVNHPHSIAEQIYRTILCDDFDSFKKIIESNPEAINLTYDGKTPLQQACGGFDKGKIEFVRYLLDKGVDVNAMGDCEYSCYSPLHLAGYGKKVEIARLLLQHGADPRIKSIIKSEMCGVPVCSPIHISTDRNYLQLLLTDGRIDVKEKDGNGKTVLDYLIKEYVRWNRVVPNFSNLGNNYLEECLKVVAPFFSAQEISQAKIDVFQKNLVQ